MAKSGRFNRDQYQYYVLSLGEGETPKSPHYPCLLGTYTSPRIFLEPRPQTRGGEQIEAPLRPIS
jgi:hypothetical protein